MAILREVNPKFGEPGDIFTVTLTGDVFTGATECDFGRDTSTTGLRIINDGVITVKLSIGANAQPGWRDVTVIQPAVNGTLARGFEVR